MKFEYSPVKQLSPEWFAIRTGRITASRLGDWLATSVAKGKEGQPLKARADYERELWFERKFGRAFDRFVSEAMLEGRELEAFVRDQYALAQGVKVTEAGIYYSDCFAASPDGLVGDDKLVEIKVLRDNSFTEVLLGGVPEKHYKQIQGQLFASGRKDCDYVAFNTNLKKIAIWPVSRNEEFHAMLEKSVQEPLTVEDVTTNELYDIKGDMPTNFESTSLTIGGMESW